MDENIPSEQLEEGEIVDDGEFEDISDNSIIESTFGKFVSSNENLRALSLSSDSESELIRELRYKKKLLRRKTKIKHQRRRKRRRVASNTSESDSSPPRDLKCKLKEAIHISGIEESHKNTLETRLKAMGGLAANTHPTEPEDPPKADIKAAESTDKVDDTELENLRMEALKTAVLNKFQRRKRKKAGTEGQEEGAPLENKENDTPKDEQSDKKNGGKVENNALIDLEEDEDLLRASLLAGLAKKIAKKPTPNENVIPVKPVPPKLPIQVVPALPKKIVNNNFKNNLMNRIVKKHVIQKVIRPKPQVKPLIINVNDDSDSEDEVKQKQQTQQKKDDVVPTKKIVAAQIPPKTVPRLPDLNAIQSNVEKFLKEQRAKFETEHQMKVPVVNQNKSILEKSAVKLLPKSQQIEYQLLLKRLRNAEKRKRAKKLAQQKLNSAAVLEPAKNNNVAVKPRLAADASRDKDPNVEKISTAKKEVKLTGDVENGAVRLVEKQVSNEDASKSDSSHSSKVKSSRDSDASDRKIKVTNELTTLQKTLKEIKMQRNGSLQIKSKYQVLTPIIRKITETSNQRKKHEHRIKTLLQELDEARNCLSNSHERFSNLVKELVAEKEKIDKSSQESNTFAKARENGKISKENKALHVRQRLENVRNDVKSVPVTSTPIKTGVQSDVVDEPTVSTLVTSSTNNDCEDMDVCNSDEADVCQIDIVDPNDIDQIFKRKPLTKSAIPEYVSPLNFNTGDRYRHVDPLAIMCPYEVNGSCRDTDCSYKHYLKNHDRL